METTLLKKIIQYKIQWKNEENGYPVPDRNKTTINVTKELSDAHKKLSKKKSLRNSWGRYSTWSTRMYKMHSRNFKTPKTKNMR
jgi:phytoene dehydrogenase-like protein